MSESAESVLDAATGLPELPEGYWWVVEKPEDSEWYRRHIYQVAIKKTVVVEERKVRRDGILGWFGGRRVMPETTEESYVSFRGVEDEDGIGVYHLTPELIRTTAVGLLEDLNRERTTENLLGAYPPKVLKG